MENIKFTQELKDKWLEALRSGEYAQTTETLKDSNGFCCLGVLCDILDPNGWNDDKSLEEQERHNYAPNVYGRDFCQLYEGNKSLYEDVEDLLPVDYSELSSRNDGNDEYEPHNFSEMADWIEENVPANG